jgi:ubiquinone/menaquinone biosynthesis C-methylase UbiE
MVESRAYFAQVAADWEDLRSGFFTEAMRDAAIERAALPGNAFVADVGTGAGFVIAGLLDKAARLTGFDESPEMLAAARERFGDRPEVTFVLSEGRRLQAGDESFDAVFANMYLHHAPDPAQAIAEMVRVLRQGGKLVITDLDTHDQSWMREAMADRWLGFDREEIRRWYTQAGLTELDIDCAEGTCDCAGPASEEISLSVFVAIGQKPAAG